MKFSNVTPELLAKFFHRTYEKLAPDYSYETRKQSAVCWSDVPEKNKQLMLATCSEVLKMLSVLQTVNEGKNPKTE